MRIASLFVVAWLLVPCLAHGDEPVTPPRPTLPPMASPSADPPIGTAVGPPAPFRAVPPPATIPVPLGPPGGILPPNAVTPIYPEITPLLAKSGRIELRGITILRAKVVGTPISESRPSLRLDLSIAPRESLPAVPPAFPTEPLGEVPMAADPAPGGITPLLPPPVSAPRRTELLLMRIDDLEPIFDDTKQLLSTKERLAAMRLGEEDTPLGIPFTSVDQLNFNFALALDAPARRAVKIPLLKGKLIVSKRKTVPLGFKDLTKMDGRPLEHPKLKGFEIRATVKTEGNRTFVSLKLPPNQQRVLVWGLAKDGAMLPPIGNSVGGGFQPVAMRSFPNPLGGGGGFIPAIAPLSPTESTQEYAAEDAKGAILGIALAEGVEPMTFPFEFKDIELP